MATSFLSGSARFLRLSSGVSESTATVELSLCNDFAYGYIMVIVNGSHVLFN